jgi:cytochrome c-type biogenesis protein CcmH
MTDAPPIRSRPSAATLILIAAALIAIVSAAVAISRTMSHGDADDPAAKDWRVVGWAYAENGDAKASADAYRKAAKLEPGNPENWSSLGESLQSASTTVVPEAAEALGKAIALDASDPRARYFLAVQKDLGGDHKGALADWTALLRDTPPGAPWAADLRRTIEQTAQRNKLALPAGLTAGASAAPPVATAAIPGPTQEQLAAASSIPPGQQDQMVQAMVARLAARLDKNPKDADGWIQLMRSRSVLNDPAGAQKALRSGLAAFAGDAPTQSRLRAAAAQLGVTIGG